MHVLVLVGLRDIDRAVVRAHWEGSAVVEEFDRWLVWSWVRIPALASVLQHT